MTALSFARRIMETPAINMVEIVDLTPADSLLPILECVSNSTISLSQTDLPVQDRRIDVEVIRGEPRTQSLFENVKPIKDVVVSDNGIGFNDKNYKSFETPHSNILREQFGCLGVGRFTVLAAFQKMKVRSTFRVNGHWQYREFDFDTDREVTPIADRESDHKVSQTVVELRGLYNNDLYDKTAVPVDVIAKAIMEHFLVFYLSDNLPQITVRESDGSASQNVNELYKDVSRENERSFKVLDKDFKLYITRNPRTTSRKYHYVHYCADSRVVGRGRRLGNLDSIFNYPLLNHTESFLDVYVVSRYLDEKKTPTRNNFRIPATDEDRNYDQEITFESIGRELVKILRDEYSDHVKQAQERDLLDWKKYIAVNPRYGSLLKDEEVLRSLPANTPDEKKEEELHRIIHRRQKSVDERIQEFISTKQVKEDSIQEIVTEIHNKAVLDRDSLADYMIRRKAVIDLFDKFLEADRQGDYKLESDIHNLIFPMGGTSEDTEYGAHNLWLLDERLVSYKFIASDKELGAICDIKSRKAADIVMFDNPIGFGDREHGDISSLVIFEFKRPGEVAGTMPKHYRWEFSILTDKYFDDFRYGTRKKIKNKGRSVNVRETTPKFGYIILSEIPEALETYNREHGWQKTPFGTFYKITPASNLHIEAMTFDRLIGSARLRHNPIFDRLFVGARHATP